MMRNTHTVRAMFLMGLSLCGLVHGQTFRPAMDGDRSIGAGITAPVAADFNGDGLLDLAVHGVTDIKIYLGNGDGTFLPPAVTSLNGTETRIFYHAATAGDFNHDGNTDLIAYGRYFEGNGDGSLKYVGPSAMEHHLETLELYSGADWGVAGFTASGIYGISMGEHPNQTFQTVDAPYAAPWFLYANEGDVPYGIVATGGPPSPLFRGPPPLLLGNLEGLGSPLRLFMLPPNNGPGLLPGSGSRSWHVGLVGTGGLRVFRLPNLGEITGAEEVQTRPVPGILNDVAYFNVDGGRWDLVTAQVDGSMASIGYYSGSGTEFAPFTPLYTFSITDPNVTLTVGDWNKDGRPDIVTQDGASVRLYLGKPAVYAVSSASAEVRVAPGSLATVYGQDLAPGTVAVPLLSALPKTLGGVRVHIDEGDSSYDADLLYVSPSQINFRVRPESRTGLLLGQVLGAGSVDFSLSADPEAPGLFTSDGTHAVASVSSSDTTWDVLLYATGLNGAPASKTSVLVNGQTLTPESVSEMPDVAGLDLVRVLIPKPASCMASLCLPPIVQLKVLGVSSNSARLELTDIK